MHIQHLIFHIIYFQIINKMLHLGNAKSPWWDFIMEYFNNEGSNAEYSDFLCLNSPVMYAWIIYYTNTTVHDEIMLFAKSMKVTWHANLFRIILLPCGGNRLFDGGFLSPVMRTFNIFFYVRPDKLLKKQSIKNNQATRYVRSRSAYVTSL